MCLPTYAPPSPFPTSTYGRGRPCACPLTRHPLPSPPQPTVGAGLVPAHLRATPSFPTSTYGRGRPRACPLTRHPSLPHPQPPVGAGLAPPHPTHASPSQSPPQRAGGPPLVPVPSLLISSVIILSHQWHISPARLSPPLIWNAPDFTHSLNRLSTMGHNQMQTLPRPCQSRRFRPP